MGSVNMKDGREFLAKKRKAEDEKRTKALNKSPKKAAVKPLDTDELKTLAVLEAKKKAGKTLTQAEADQREDLLHVKKVATEEE